MVRVRDLGYRAADPRRPGLERARVTVPSRLLLVPAHRLRPGLEHQEHARRRRCLSTPTSPPATSQTEVILMAGLPMEDVPMEVSLTVDLTVDLTDQMMGKATK